MEGGESLLDTLFDEESLEDAQDVEMLDVEEESNRKAKRKKKKKKNKRKRGSSADPDVTNINRFVLDACKRLREKKSYLMYTAVGCLGAAALGDLVMEVEAIQACGGQKIADGSRFRNGGGILWNIIKSRDPNAFKEIMRRGKEFEKQFKQQLPEKQEPKKWTEASSQSIILDSNPAVPNQSADGLNLISHDQNPPEILTPGQKHASVHDRIRVPVTYDDLLEGEAPKDKLG